MKLFKSRIEKLISKITEKNLDLLNTYEQNSIYHLKKLYDWQEDYDWIEWKEFESSWFYCDKCEGYSEGSCICYAR